jgi:RNA-directed DNA polymerase
MGTYDFGTLAQALNLEPKILNYILYKIPDFNKYHDFEIPKRSGEMRMISAPSQKLKSIQKKLAKILQAKLNNQISHSLSGIAN